MLVVGSSKRFL